jgi:hypothetical protein
MELDQATLTAPEEEKVVSMDDTIGDAWREIQSRGNQDRDEGGKFAAKESEPVETTEEQTELPAEETPAEETAPAIKAPSSWKKEAQAKFATLPPDIQAEVMRREGDMHRGLESYKQHAERAQAYERAFTPYMDTINKLGIAPEVAASELMKVDHSLRYGSPADKVAMVTKIIKDYGIDPAWFDSANIPQANPQVDYLQNELQAIKAQQARLQQESQTRETVSLNNDIASFAKNNEHFEAVRDRMADLLQGGAAKTLQEAYETAIWADPSVRASIIAKQQSEERAKAAQKASEAKKLASTNVRARGTIPAQAAVGTIEDTIRARAKELGMY